MAQCDACGRDMQTTEGCDQLDPTRIPFGKESEDWWAGVAPPERCHDCNAAKGGYHHPGCDMEQCPTCGDQAIGCDCEPAWLE